jgi:lipid-binding SYLF domain-containing protein
MMRKIGISRASLAPLLCLSIALAVTLLPVPSHAASAARIDASANQTLALFRNSIKGGRVILRDARGVLIFPEVIQAGIGIGGEYGEGVMRIHGRDAGYYSITAGSWGLQFGAQRKSVIIAFLQDQALRHFQNLARSGKYWQAGVDGSIALVTVGGQASVNTTTFNAPVVAYVFDQKGLMYNLTLQGAKITRINR